VGFWESASRCDECRASLGACFTFSTSSSILLKHVDLAQWRHCRAHLIVLATITILMLAISHADVHFFNIPYHSLALTSLAWMNKLLRSPSPHRLEENLGINQVAFLGILKNLIKHSGFCNNREVFQ
jgi:hypothetical protein